MRRELKRLRGYLTPAEFETVHAFTLAVRADLREQERKAAVLAVENRALRLVAARLAGEVISRRLGK